MDKNTKLLIIILCLVLFAIGFGAGFLTHYALNKTADFDNDRQAYEALKGSTDVQAYDVFLAEYPDSPYAASVRERKEKVQSMKAEWYQIQAIGNKGDFQNFKANYNDPYYNRLCDMKIDSLEYINAQTANTIQAYKAYLRMYPEGRYADAANEALETAMSRAASRSKAQEEETTATPADSTAA